MLLPQAAYPLPPIKRANVERMSQQESSTTTNKIKAVCFDFVGTCLDWHSAIIAALPPGFPAETKSGFILDWRQAYFNRNDRLFSSGSALEDVDVSYRQALEEVLERPENSSHKHLFTEAVKDVLIRQWHAQKPWDEVPEALRGLKEDRGYEVFVHANGTTRFQLDLVKASGLKHRFDMLFSSELLGSYKPAPENYGKVLGLLKYAPEQVVMVAAHAYDLRGAKNVALRTVYVHRWTDDVLEDQGVIKGEFDAYLEDMSELGATIASL
ncbi:haloacid dehalogenase [Xylaria arbuscula]|nr:haloacid dehalogenase [Xylaria arbuscula]